MLALWSVLLHLVMASGEEMSKTLLSVALGKVNIICLFFFQILHMYLVFIVISCSNFRLETFSTSVVKLRDII